MYIQLLLLIPICLIYCIDRQNTGEEERKDYYYYVLPVEHVSRGF
jgi:hypothetical protein